jgi:N-acetylglucosamine malate deacetylase 2
MGPEEILRARSVLMVVAHPDDEVIGGGSLFQELGNRLTIVHVTNGSPQNPTDARNAGFNTSEEYSRARFEESFAAAELSGIPRQQFRQLGFGDQQAAHDLHGVTLCLIRLFKELQPEVVLTHPYEGGHPDHDAAAFAVRTATELSGQGIRIGEFCSYHAGVAAGVCETQVFLGDPGITRDLTPRQKQLKRAMFDCFVTQQHVLRMFSPEVERFRTAPDYDFTRPPHAGRLHYENFDWGMQGARFCEAAALCHSQLLASLTR